MCSICKYSSIAQDSPTVFILPLQVRFSFNNLGIFKWNINSAYLLIMEYVLKLLPCDPGQFLIPVAMPGTGTNTVYEWSSLTGIEDQDNAIWSTGQCYSYTFCLQGLSSVTNRRLTKCTPQAARTTNYKISNRDLLMIKLQPPLANLRDYKPQLCNTGRKSRKSCSYEETPIPSFAPYPAGLALPYRIPRARISELSYWIIHVYMYYALLPFDMLDTPLTSPELPLSYSQPHEAA